MTQLLSNKCKKKRKKNPRVAGQPTNRPAHQPKGANPSPIPLTTQARTREAEPSRSLLTSSAARRQERSLPLDSPARARSPWPLPLPLQPPAPPELASSLLSLSPFPPCAPTSSVSRGCVRAGAAPAALVASALLSVGRRHAVASSLRRPSRSSSPPSRLPAPFPAAGGLPQLVSPPVPWRPVVLRPASIRGAWPRLAGGPLPLRELRPCLRPRAPAPSCTRAHGAPGRPCTQRAGCRARCLLPPAFLAAAAAPAASSPSSTGAPRAVASTPTPASYHLPSAPAKCSIECSRGALHHSDLALLRFASGDRSCCGASSAPVHSLIYFGSDRAKCPGDRRS